MQLVCWILLPCGYVGVMQLVCSILLPSGYVGVMQLVCSILLPSGYVWAAFVLKIRNRLNIAFLSVLSGTIIAF